MNLVTISGPPSSGKTSVILKTIDALKRRKVSVGVVKFDCLHTDDDVLYEKAGLPVKKGLSGALCPDHYFVSNIEEVTAWGLDLGLDLLVTESAGLCNRCSPYIKDIKAICVIDNLSGINTPKKIGPMLKTADGRFRRIMRFTSYTPKGNCPSVRIFLVAPTRFSPPISIHSMGNPAAGTRLASIPSRVPTKSTSWPRERSFRATASAGITCPPVPPPAMRNTRTAVIGPFHSHSATVQAKSCCSAANCRRS